MNLKERDEWIRAVGSCFPELKAPLMSQACAAIETPGRWEAAVRGGTLAGAGLRFLPDGGAGWLEALWDLESGACLSGKPFSPEPRGKERPFKPGVFGEPSLDRALADFHALCPVGTIAFETNGWSLRFARPPRWPLFARCEISAAFTPHSSQLGLFLLDRRVTGLRLAGEALWAHCAG